MRHNPTRRRIAVGRAILHALLAGFVSAALGGLAGGEPAQSLVSAPVVLTNAQQVLDVGLARARAETVQVHLRGVVTYVPIAQNRWLYLQDETAGVLVVADSEPFRYAAGQSVEVEGSALAGLFAVHVRGQSLRLLGQAPLPKPRPTPAAALAGGAEFGRWVALHGTVRDLAYYPGRLEMVCVSEGFRFTVVALCPQPAVLPVQLLDARLDLRGVAWTDVDTDVRPVGFTLHQPDLNCYTVLRAGSSNVFDRSSRTVATVRQLRTPTEERVKLTGIVTLSSPSGWLALKDETGAVWARQLRPLPRVETTGALFHEAALPAVQPGTRVELVGAPLGDRTSAPELEDAEFRVVGSGPPPTPQPVSGMDLTSGRLDAELVTLRAQVKDVEARRGQDLFVEKLWLQSGGVMFEAMLETREPATLVVRRDDFVAVTGVCRMEPGQLQQVRSARLQLRGPSDLIVMPAPLWWAWRWAVWPLGGATLVLAAGGVWITSLRRQVARRTTELSGANRQLHEEVQKRQHAEVELRSALAAEKELNQLKGNFVSMVSHEIRTPLALILSSADILQQYADRLAPAKREQHLETIHHAVQRMSALIEDVLLFSRAEAGRLEFKPEALDLTAFCARLVDEVRSATGGFCPIELTLDCPGSPLLLDASLLRYILTNLLTNAVKYSPPGTPVALEVSGSSQQTRFVVRDRGIGIPEAEQRHLFTPFHRAHNAEHVPGTGLGLVIVKRCVERHGGQLQIASRVGSGTTATVSLPAGNSALMPPSSTL